MPKIFFTDLQSRIEKFNLKKLGTKVVQKYLLIGGSTVALVLSIFLTARLTQRPTTPEITQAESCSPVSGQLSFVAVERPQPTEPPVELPECPEGWGCTPAYQCTPPFYEIHPDQNTIGFVTSYSCSGEGDSGEVVCCRELAPPPCTPNWQCSDNQECYETDANNCGEADRYNEACCPPEPPSGWSPSWCGQYDLSGDNLVDIDDFGKGRACINNPGCGVPVPGRLGTSNWAEVDPDQFMDDLRACFGKTGS